MIKLPLHVTKYLNKYSSGQWHAEVPDNTGIKNIVVIPATDEFENIKILLRSLSHCENKYFHSALFLFVINNTEAAVDVIKENNRQSLVFLRELIKGKQACGVSEEISRSKLRIGLVDASSDGREMPAKEGGVGLARKIGMDLALRLFDYSNSSKNILVCLDADCRVSENYLSSIVDDFNTRGLDAASIYFEHTLIHDDETTRAIICYEIFLRYYVLCLKFSNSYYSFHTIGSSMACTAESYIKIEGMNKRKAAEDFYFLEKLAKNFNIAVIKDAVVYPSPRGSWRVPFGTGQRVNRYFAHTHDEYLLYSPKSFDVLKEWQNLFFNGSVLKGAEYLELSVNINEELTNFLIANDFQSSFEKILKNSKTDEQIKMQKLKWFDGFKTLKLIHHLRDNAFPNEFMFSALDEMFRKAKLKSIKRNNADIVPPIETQTEYLNELRIFDKK